MDNKILLTWFVLCVGFLKMLYLKIWESTNQRFKFNPHTICMIVSAVCDT